MVASVLKNHGYATAGFTTNPLLGAHVKYDAGFDVFEELLPEKNRSGWTKVKGMQRLLRIPTFQRGLSLIGIDGCPPRIYAKGDVLTDRANQWLESVNKEFFLWLHYMDPHWPYHTHARLQTPSDYAKGWRDMSVMHDAYHAKYPGDDAMERAITMYNEGIVFMDAQIGRLLQTIGGRDLLDNTAIIIASDHGEEFFEHGCWQHGASVRMFDELLLVPLLLKLPGQSETLSVSQQVQLLDVAPTILEIAGVDPHPAMEGTSLLALVNGSEGYNSTAVISEMVSPDWHVTAIRTEKHKYIYNDRRPDERLLFDLSTDPGEKANIFGQNPQIEAYFERILQEHLEQVKETQPTHDGEGWESDEEVLRRLRDLGYLD
jgi:arylsulfatase A-like enzyme